MNEKQKQKKYGKNNIKNILHGSGDAGRRNSA